MKKTVMIGAILGLALTIGIESLSASAGDSLKTPATELVIDGKKPARFNHTTHVTLGLNCGTCHHDAEHKALTAEAIAALPDTKALSCITCHNSSFSNKDLQKQKDVFHARCKECHKTGHNGKKGPSGCADCHIKQEKKAVEGC
ncbi:MAG: cytochrome c family protein [Proteobacteria bacterium]|nr:cytochrome c family protein [Pseudomonadota bacterium]MDP2107192.1 cytochrome c3 family protein [Desulfobulbaceae bacterium]